MFRASSTFEQMHAGSVREHPDEGTTSVTKHFNFVNVSRIEWAAYWRLTPHAGRVSPVTSVAETF
jgi:hypothetical protein